MKKKNLTGSCQTASSLPYNCNLGRNVLCRSNDTGNDLVRHILCLNDDEIPLTQTYNKKWCYGKKNNLSIEGNFKAKEMFSIHANKLKILNRKQMKES